jgi:hypothetical protein
MQLHQVGHAQEDAGCKALRRSYILESWPNANDGHHAAAERISKAAMPFVIETSLMLHHATGDRFRSASNICGHPLSWSVCSLCVESSAY